MLNKSSLRQQAKQIKQCCLSKAILQHVSHYIKASVVLGYCALPYESDVEKPLMQALMDGKELYLPRVEADFQLSYYRVFDLASDLEVGHYGIKEPKMSLQKWSTLQLYDTYHLLLAPALATTKNGYRLGHGMGYYDRFLSSLDKRQRDRLCTMVVVNSQMSDCEFEIEAHDVAFDFILSELGLIDCNI